MAVVRVTSFWIHDLRMWGIWSPIHLLSIFTLGALPFAVMHARGHRVAQHRNAMIAMFAGALLIAGCSPSCPAASCTPWRSATD